tara:strand:+ start:1038 stop:1190 length:153 start_codon:yes stop_codon:yes gene_type:complete
MPGGMYKMKRPGIKRKTGSAIMNKKLKGALTDKEVQMMMKSRMKRKRRVK